LQIIKTEGLTKRFGWKTAVKDVNLSISRGEAFALLGPNGAGKTTIIRILSTLLRPSAGKAAVMGYDVASEPEEVKRRIGVVSHNPCLYGKLTSRENLSFYAGLYDVDLDVDRLLDRMGLLSVRGEYVETLSRGMKQRLAIARAIIHEPPVLLLDEPSAGLDVESRKSFHEMLMELNSRGTSLLLTTHFLEEAALLCRRGAIMNRGSIVAEVGFDDGTKEAEEVFFSLNQGAKP
jgi:heme ABC exporter ATP-binding subunit CcmA